MSEDLRAIAEQLADPEGRFPGITPCRLLAADYIRSLDEGERLRDMVQDLHRQAFVHREPVYGCDYCAALSPQP